jgi:integrating conjugative element relaxase (TIGR03760 family)
MGPSPPLRICAAAMPSDSAFAMLGKVFAFLAKKPVLPSTTGTGVALSPAVPSTPLIEHHYADIAQRIDKPVLTGAELIALLRLESRVAELRDLMSIPNADWQACCMSAILNFAESVQLAPASEVHHHAYCGGLLVHTLDAAMIALKLRRKYSLPAGAGAERVNEASTRWTYGVLVAVLLHDPGKVGSSVNLRARDAHGASTSWSPLNGSMCKHSMVSYQISFERAPYRLHNQVGLALFAELIPEAGRRWLSVDAELLAQLLAAVSDVHTPGSGVIGELLVQADGQSVARDLGQPKPKLQQTGATAVPLIDRYMRCLRSLIADGRFVLNKPGAQIFVVRKKAAPEAAADVWMLCRAVGEVVVKELRANDSSIPTSIERFYDTLQEFGICIATASGRAIWTATVHIGDWHSEFSMLRFEAYRLFGPGKVPPALEGSVKVSKLTKPTSATVVQPTTEQRCTPSTSAPIVDNSWIVEATQTIAPDARPTTVSEAEVAALFEPVRGKKKLTTVTVVSTESTSAPEALKLIAATVARANGAIAGNLADAFFAWIKAQLKQPEADINSPSAMLHIHEDGLLLVTPKIFKTYAGDEDWIAVQKAVSTSGYLLCVSRRHVHEYMIKDPQGKVGKATLKCAVILPAATKALQFGKLPPQNKSIVGRK